MALARKVLWIVNMNTDTTETALGGLDIQADSFAAPSGCCRRNAFRLRDDSSGTFARGHTMLN